MKEEVKNTVTQQVNKVKDEYFEMWDYFTTTYAWEDIADIKFILNEITYKKADGLNGDNNMYPYDEVPIRHDPHLGLKIHEEKIELGNPNSDIEKGEKFIKENHEIKRVAIEHDPETNQIHEFDLKAEKVFLITKKNSWNKKIDTIPLLEKKKYPDSYYIHSDHPESKTFFEVDGITYSWINKQRLQIKENREFLIKHKELDITIDKNGKSVYSNDYYKDSKSINVDGSETVYSKAISDFFHNIYYYCNKYTNNLFDKVNHSARMINHKKEKFGNIVESGLTEGQRSDFQNTKVSFSPNYNKKSSAYINNKGESCENLEWSKSNCQSIDEIYNYPHNKIHRDKAYFDLDEAVRTKDYSSPQIESHVSRDPSSAITQLMGSPEGAQYLGAADVDIQKVISNNFINNNNSFRDLTDVKTIAPDKTTLLENHHLTQCQPCWGQLAEGEIKYDNSNFNKIIQNSREKELIDSLPVVSNNKPRNSVVLKFNEDTRGKAPRDEEQTFLRIIEDLNRTDYKSFNRDLIKNEFLYEKKIIVSEAYHDDSDILPFRKLNHSDNKEATYYKDDLSILMDKTNFNIRPGEGNASKQYLTMVDWEKKKWDTNYSKETDLFEIKNKDDLDRYYNLFANKQSKDDKMYSLATEVNLERIDDFEGNQIERQGLLNDLSNTVTEHILELNEADFAGVVYFSGLDPFYYTDVINLHSLTEDMTDPGSSSYNYNENVDKDLEKNHRTVDYDLDFRALHMKVEQKVENTDNYSKLSDILKDISTEHVTEISKHGELLYVVQPHKIQTYILKDVVQHNWFVTHNNNKFYFYGVDSVESRYIDVQTMPKDFWNEYLVRLIREWEKIENLTTYRVNDTHKYFEFLQKVEDIRVEVYNNLIDELIQEIERRESSQKNPDDSTPPSSQKGNGGNSSTATEGNSSGTQESGNFDKYYEYYYTCNSNGNNNMHNGTTNQFSTIIDTIIDTFSVTNSQTLSYIIALFAFLSLLFYNQYKLKNYFKILYASVYTFFESFFLFNLRKLYKNLFNKWRWIYYFQFIQDNTAQNYPMDIPTNTASAEVHYDFENNDYNNITKRRKGRYRRYLNFETFYQGWLPNTSPNYFPNISYLFSESLFYNLRLKYIWFVRFFYYLFYYLLYNFKYFFYYSFIVTLFSIPFVKIIIIFFYKRYIIFKFKSNEVFVQKMYHLLEKIKEYFFILKFTMLTVEIMEMFLHKYTFISLEKDILDDDVSSRWFIFYKKIFQTKLFSLNINLKDIRFIFNFFDYLVILISVLFINFFYLFKYFKYSTDYLVKITKWKVIFLNYLLSLNNLNNNSNFSLIRLLLKNLIVRFYNLIIFIIKKIIFFIIKIIDNIIFNLILFISGRIIMALNRIHRVRFRYLLIPVFWTLYIVDFYSFGWYVKFLFLGFFEYYEINYAIEVIINFVKTSLKINVFDSYLISIKDIPNDIANLFIINDYKLYRKVHYFVLEDQNSFIRSLVTRKSLLDEIYINRLYTEYSEILKSYLNKIHLYKTQANVKSIEFLELLKKKNEINKEKNLFLLDFNKIIISENSKYVLLNSVKNDELSRIIINNTFDSHNISFHDGWHNYIKFFITITEDQEFFGKYFVISDILNFYSRWEVFRNAWNDFYYIPQIMEAIKDLNSTRIRETNSIYLNNLKTIRDLLEHKYSSKVKFSINEYDYVKQALHSYYVESIKWGKKYNNKEYFSQRRKWFHRTLPQNINFLDFFTKSKRRRYYAKFKKSFFASLYILNWTETVPYFYLFRTEAWKNYIKLWEAFYFFNVNSWWTNFIYVTGKISIYLADYIWKYVSNIIIYNIYDFISLILKNINLIFTELIIDSIKIDEEMSIEEFTLFKNILLNTSRPQIFQPFLMHFDNCRWYNNIWAKIMDDSAKTAYWNVRREPTCASLFTQKFNLNKTLNQIRNGRDIKHLEANLNYWIDNRIGYWKRGAIKVKNYLQAKYLIPSKWYYKFVMEAGIKIKNMYEFFFPKKPELKVLTKTKYLIDNTIEKKKYLKKAFIIKTNYWTKTVDYIEDVSVEQKTIVEKVWKRLVINKKKKLHLHFNKYNDLKKGDHKKFKISSLFSGIGNYFNNYNKYVATSRDLKSNKFYYSYNINNHFQNKEFIDANFPWGQIYFLMMDATLKHTDVDWYINSLKPQTTYGFVWEYAKAMVYWWLVITDFDPPIMVIYGIFRSFYLHTTKITFYIWFKFTSFIDILYINYDTSRSGIYHRKSDVLNPIHTNFFSRLTEFALKRRRSRYHRNIGLNWKPLYNGSMLRLMFNNYNKPPHYISLFVTKFSGFNYNHNFVIVFGYYYLFIFTFIIFHRLDFVTGYPNKIDPNINAEYLWDDFREKSIEGKGSYNTQLRIKKKHREYFADYIWNEDYNFNMNIIEGEWNTMLKKRRDLFNFSNKESRFFDLIEYLPSYHSIKLLHKKYLNLREAYIVDIENISLTLDKIIALKHDYLLFKEGSMQKVFKKYKTKYNSFYNIHTNYYNFLAKMIEKGKYVDDKLELLSNYEFESEPIEPLVLKDVKKWDDTIKSIYKFFFKIEKTFFNDEVLPNWVFHKDMFYSTILESIPKINEKNIYGRKEYLFVEGFEEVSWNFFSLFLIMVLPMSIYIYTIAMLTHKMSYLGTVNYTYKLRYFLEKLSRRNFYYYLNFLLHSKIFHDYYIDILKFRWYGISSKIKKRHTTSNSLYSRRNHLDGKWLEFAKNSNTYTYHKYIKWNVISKSSYRNFSYHINKIHLYSSSFVGICLNLFFIIFFIIFLYIYKKTKYIYIFKENVEYIFVDFFNQEKYIKMRNMLQYKKAILNILNFIQKR